MADITAKLAQVVSPTQIAINAGSERGVKLGDQVLLYRQVHIEDPDTKEPLGSVRVPRLALKVTYVAEAFSIADVTSTDLDYPIATNLFALGRVKVTTSLGAGVNTLRVNIGEEVTIRSQGSTAGET